MTKIASLTPFGGKGTMDGYRCELCGAWVEYRNLSKVLAHEGPLPHVRPGSMPCPICNRYRRAPPSVGAVLDAKPASRSSALPRRVPAFSIGPCGAPNAAISMKRRSTLTPCSPMLRAGFMASWRSPIKCSPEPLSRLGWGAGKRRNRAGHAWRARDPVLSELELWRLFR